MAKTQSTLLSIPLDIRSLIYDQIFDRGYVVTIGFQTQCTLSKALALLRVCRYLYNEIQPYISRMPLTLYCARGNRPSVVHRIPRRILNQAQVVVIEDSAHPNLELGLLPNLKAVCFCDVYTSYYGRDATAAQVLTIAPQLLPTASSSYLTSTEVEFIQRKIMSLFSDPDSNNSSSNERERLVAGLQERLSAVPANNNEILKEQHQQWKDLRCNSLWIRALWKNRKDIQVVLRRVNEVILTFNDIGENVPVRSEAEDGCSGGIVLSYHTIVDVDSRKVIEKKRFPVHDLNEEAVHHYGKVSWWRNTTILQDESKSSTNDAPQ